PHSPAFSLPARRSPDLSARSAHSSPQNGGPKGKMIEGRSGGSGRGTRRELWAPPDSGSAHRRIAGLYRVRLSTRSRSLRRPRISFPPPLPHPSHLPAGPREKFCRTQAHVQLGTRLREMAGPRLNSTNDSMWYLGVGLKEKSGPHLTAVLLTDESQV